MNQAWCSEYRQLSIKSEAIQRECTKIKEKLRESQLLSSCTPAKRIIQKKGNKQANNDKISIKQDWQQEKNILGEKIHCLHKHCATVKDSLILLTKKEIEEETIKINATEERRKRAKQLVDAIEAYEDLYERLRYQCDNEITNLESKRVGLYQSIMCIMKLANYV